MNIHLFHEVYEARTARLYFEPYRAEQKLMLFLSFLCFMKNKPLNSLLLDRKYLMFLFFMKFNYICFLPPKSW